MSRLKVIMLCAVFVFAGCESEKTSYRLQYTLYNQDDQVVETGLWKFSVDPIGNVSGTWMCDGNGNGQMIGRMTGQTLTLTINPDWADAGTYIDGTLKGHVWSGTWSYETIAGPKEGGIFSAR